MAKSFSGDLRGLWALIAGFGAVVLMSALLLPGSAGAQAVVNTVKLGACDDLLGVCLANPTQRYKHGVFGQPFEYGTILTIDETGAALRPHNLPFEQVFEDRRVRVVDLDDDGLSEVILIVADRDRGALTGGLALGCRGGGPAGGRPRGQGLSRGAGGVRPARHH